MVSVMDNSKSQNNELQLQNQQQQQQQQQQEQKVKIPKSAVSQKSVEIEIAPPINTTAEQDLNKRELRLDLVSTTKSIEEFSIKSPKSPKSPIAAGHSGRLSQQSSVVDLDNRKSLREALYQGIFHRHRKTIFAMGSFLRMLRSRSAQYNTIRSSSGEDINDVR